LAAVFVMLVASSAGAMATGRSHAEKAAFQREHPCPSTGQRRGRCPGYVIDHVQPLCAGGPDSPWNMQWQTAAEAKAKDVVERRECRSLRRRR
jgi:hypothetical protein